MRLEKYKKKPVVIDAIQWDGTEVMAEAIIKIMGKGEYKTPDYKLELGPELVIPTLEGNMTAIPKDWIIRGVAGEFYPCKDTIFKATYDSVDHITIT